MISYFPLPGPCPEKYSLELSRLHTRLHRIAACAPRSKGIDGVPLKNQVIEQQAGRLLRAVWVRVDRHTSVLYSVHLEEVVPSYVRFGAFIYIATMADAQSSTPTDRPLSPLRRQRACLPCSRAKARCNFSEKDIANGCDRYC
jgi:hypothetical protein